MKILISGAQGVGKTTLINRLKETLKFDFVFEEVVRQIAKRGFKVNQAGNDATQEEVINAHLQNLECDDSKIALYDRGILDCCAYSLDLKSKDKISDFTLAKIEYILKSNIQKYDLIFYIEPEFVIQNDGFRDTSKEYQTKITQCFENLIKKYKIEVVRLSGNVETRLQTILNEIGQRNPRC